MIVVGGDGSIAVLDARDGRPRLEASLGTAVRAAEVRGHGLALPELAADAPAAAPLRDQLRTAAALRDARIGGGRALAIRFLARDRDAAVTEQLIALCSDRADPSQARTSACDELAARETGDPFVLAALREGASFLEERPAPPVGALARAAASMHLRQALPYLVAHLEDPATPIEELPGLFDGLARLGDARALAPVERFLRLYHADATDARMIQALGAAASAVATLAPQRVDAVRALADDPLAPAPARERITLALAPPPAATQATAPTPPVREARAPEPEPEPEGELPDLITDETVEHVLAPVQARLRRRLERPEGDPLPSARVVLMVGEDGAIQTVAVTPADLQACVEPLVHDRTFPRTRRGRQVVVHTVRR